MLRWPVSINIPAPLANGLEEETLALDVDDDRDDEDDGDCKDADDQYDS